MSNAEFVTGMSPAEPPKHEGVCPHCGYCPTCGRQNAPTAVYPRRLWYGGEYTVTSDGTGTVGRDTA